MFGLRSGPFLQEFSLRVGIQFSPSVSFLSVLPFGPWTTVNTGQKSQLCWLQVLSFWIHDIKQVTRNNPRLPSHGVYCEIAVL